MKPEIHGHSIRSILIGPSFTIFSVDSQIRGLKIIGWIPGLNHSRENEFLCPLNSDFTVCAFSW